VLSLRLTGSVLLVLASVAALLAGCGGGGASDQQQIEDLLVQGYTTTKPAQKCEEALSAALLKRVYGTAARCRTVEKSPDKSRPATVEVSAVKVTGDAGTAFVELKGGDQDGARGSVDLVRQGDDWRIEGFSAPLLRSTFDASMKNDRTIQADLKTCLAAGVGKLSDAQLVDFAYASMGERPEGAKQVQAILADCQVAASGAQSAKDGSSDGGTSFLRKKFEEGVVNSLKGSGTSQKAIDCVKRELRKRISDQQIVDLIGKGGKSVPPEIATAAAGALAACGTSG